MTMDLQTLRINRTPVSENRKCEGCVHYDGNAAAKGGACEVGQSPALCGNGGEPKYGYAALADLSPDEVDDLATPLINGPQGTMNEHGEIEKTITMKRVCLGDEDLTIAQRIHGEQSKYTKKSWGYADGQVNAFAGAELAHERTVNPEHPMIDVAKSLHDMYMSPRKQHKYGVTDVLAFLQSRGMPVTDDEMEVCKSRFGATRQVPVGHAENPTLPQAAAGLRAHNTATRAPGGMGSQTPSAPVAAKPRRSGSATQQMPIAKSMPNVRKIGGDSDPFDRSRLSKSTGGEGSRGGKVIGHTKSGKPVYEGVEHKNWSQHNDHFRTPENERKASAEDAMQASQKAYSKAYAAHKMSSRSHSKKHKPETWDPAEHHAAAEAYEEAAVHHEHASHHANPSRPDTEGLRRPGEPEYLSKEWHQREAEHRNIRAEHHRLKADIAQHLRDKQYGLAHDTAKQLAEHPQAGAHALDKLDHEKILEHVAKKTSKVPHNEMVARDAEQEGKHDVAAKLRRLRKSETPNVRRIG